MDPNIDAPFLAGRAHLCANRCRLSLQSACLCPQSTFGLRAIHCSDSPRPHFPMLASWTMAYNPDESFLLMPRSVAVHASHICMPWLEQLLHSGKGRGGSGCNCNCVSHFTKCAQDTESRGPTSNPSIPAISGRIRQFPHDASEVSLSDASKYDRAGKPMFSGAAPFSLTVLFLPRLSFNVRPRISSAASGGLPLRRS
jgi:hypothetical protein